MSLPSFSPFTSHLICSSCHCPKCECVTRLVFPFKIFFFNLMEFSVKKLLKIQYLLHPRSKNFQIIFSKSYSLRAFQWYQTHAQIFLYFFSFDLNELSMKNCSIFNLFFPPKVVTLWNQLCAPLHSLKAFQWYQECSKRCYGLGVLNDKQITQVPLDWCDVELFTFIWRELVTPWDLFNQGYAFVVTNKLILKGHGNGSKNLAIVKYWLHYNNL